MNIIQLEELIHRTKNHCSEKEYNFMQSAKTFLVSRHYLSDNQQSWLDSISEKYSEEVILESQKWDANWSDAHRTTAKRVAYYYEANPPYYSNYVMKILANPEKFTLSKKEWDTFCENKYAKKIRKEYDSSRKFQVGDCVQIRKTNKIGIANYNKYGPKSQDGDKVGFIVRVDAKPVTRAAKGARIYQLLLAGASSPIYVHESDIKAKRKTLVEN